MSGGATPGPWDVAGPRNEWVESHTHGHVCTCETSEDAYRIAALPEVCDMLEAALRIIDKAGIIWMGDDKARAVLAKARGAS